MANSSKGNREDRPLRAHGLGSPFAVAGQIPEARFELLGAQAMLTMAGEDRVERGLHVHLVDDDDARPLHLGVTEGVHPAMQVLARRHRSNFIDVPSAAGAAEASAARSRPSR
jgi:hypothetical protein